MILTITMNPSVDISYRLNTLHMDDVNRCNDYQKTAGGKGLNVTRVIQQMDQPVIATGLIGGPLGIFIQEELDKQGISHKFSHIKGSTRNCIAILHDEGKQTEILESGPSVSEVEQADFLTLYSDLIKKSEVVTMSGSLPQGVSNTFYADLLKLTAGETKVILDSSGESLKQALLGKSKPYAIKPNETEIAQLLNVSAEDMERIPVVELLEDPLFEGVPLIVVSKGADGALVKYHDELFVVSIPKVKAINPVGSGDSTVAGLAIGLLQDKSIEDVIKTGMTLGVLNAMQEQTGFVNPAHFDELFSKINVDKIA